LNKKFSDDKIFSENFPTAQNLKGRTFARNFPPTKTPLKAGSSVCSYQYSILGTRYRYIDTHSVESGCKDWTRAPVFHYRIASHPEKSSTADNLPAKIPRAVQILPVNRRPGETFLGAIL